MSEIACKCEPCQFCGYKHFCNVEVEHPSGTLRGGGCPFELVPDPVVDELASDILRLSEGKR